MYVIILNCFVYRTICDLKHHLTSKKHGISSENAKNVTLALGLRKKCCVISPSIRKTKPRKDRLICALPFAKLDDHYENYHKLSWVEAREDAKVALFAIVESDDIYLSCISSDASSDTDLTEEEEK